MIFVRATITALCLSCILTTMGCVYPVRPEQGVFGVLQRVEPPAVFYRPVEIGIQASHDRSYNRPTVLDGAIEAIVAGFMDVIPLFPFRAHHRRILADDEIAGLLRDYLNWSHIGHARILGTKAESASAPDIQISIHLRKCVAGNWSTYYGTTRLGYYLSLGILSGGQNTSEYSFTINAVDTQTSHVILRRQYQGNQNGWFLPLFAECFIDRHGITFDLPAEAAHRICEDFTQGLDRALPPSRSYPRKKEPSRESGFVW